MWRCLSILYTPPSHWACRLTASKKVSVTACVFSRAFSRRISLKPIFFRAYLSLDPFIILMALPGALAGIIALTFASIGFVGKLLSEAIEEISKKQIEAVRATGASFMNVIAYGVVPQVMNRFIGFVAYETDSNLRNSTMVGVVGAGGIGGTLFSAFQRFDYNFVAGIIICIIGLVMIGEVLQIYAKRVFR